MTDDLQPYRERRRVRRWAAFMVGYLAGAWILPALADRLVSYLENVPPEDPTPAGVGDA